MYYWSYGKLLICYLKLSPYLWPVSSISQYLMLRRPRASASSRTIQLDFVTLHNCSPVFPGETKHPKWNVSQPPMRRMNQQDVQRKCKLKMHVQGDGEMA